MAQIPQNEMFWAQPEFYWEAKSNGQRVLF